MPRFFSLLLIMGFSLINGTVLAAPAVVASIMPVHSLVAAVMEGVGTPSLIYDGNQSPHHAAIRPSQARLIQEADLIFWIGPNLETSLAKPIDTLSGRGSDVRLIDLHSIATLTQSDHDAHEGDGHDHSGSDSLDRDPHIWLDTGNAVVIAQAVAEKLAETDPDNAGIYWSNADQLIKNINELDEALRKKLEVVRDRPFIVFHDGYRYFNERYGLNQAAAVTINPGIQPGAQTVAAIRARADEQRIACMFSEPQFDPQIITTLAEETGARMAVLDPIGADVAAGPQQYFSLMRNMANAFERCLGH